MREKEEIKPCDLFADLAKKQDAVLKNRRTVSLEEAREIVKWLKDGKADKKVRNQI